MRKGEDVELINARDQVEALERMVKDAKRRCNGAKGKPSFFKYVGKVVDLESSLESARKRLKRIEAERVIPPTSGAREE